MNALDQINMMVKSAQVARNLADTSFIDPTPKNTLKKYRQTNPNYFANAGRMEAKDYADMNTTPRTSPWGRFHALDVSRQNLNRRRTYGTKATRPAPAPSRGGYVQSRNAPVSLERNPDVTPYKAWEDPTWVAMQKNRIMRDKVQGQDGRVLTNQQIEKLSPYEVANKTRSQRLMGIQNRYMNIEDARKLVQARFAQRNPGKTLDGNILNRLAKQVSDTMYIAPNGQVMRRSGGSYGYFPKATTAAPAPALASK